MRPITDTFNQLLHISWLLLIFLLFSSSLMGQEVLCGDGIDNDGDGFIDCFDTDCANDINCDGTYLGNDIFCQVAPVQFPTFSMTSDWVSPDKTITHFGRIAVGDLESDGIPEVVAFNSYTQQLYVLNGNDGSIKRQADLTNIFRDSYSHDIAIANIDGDNCAEIFVYSRHRNDNTNRYHLAKYDCNLNFQWEFGINRDALQTIGFADFDSDGKVEIYYKNEIRDATDGTRIIRGTGDWDDVNGGPVAVDMNGDGDLELVVGCTIYDVNLGNRSLDNGSLTQINSLPTYYVKNARSMTSIADYNLDGNLDIIASGATGSVGGETTVFFWDVTNNVVRTFSDPIPALPDYVNGWKSGTGRLNIADLDGDGLLNVSYVSGRYLYALDENFNQLWRTLINEETSGFTGCTLFDFNGDGKSEVVYRDEQWLYIINGTDGSLYPGGSVPCISRTAIEYPIVADVDGDGATELCVPCGTDDAQAWANFNDLNYSENSQVRVYRSSGEPWVPARRLWNQHAYFNVNVNEDLTIPQNQQLHHLVFSSGSCTTGPNRPLNGFLNQSPYLDSNGCPTYASPDIAYLNGTGNLSVNLPTCPDQDFTVTFELENLGDVTLDGNIPITFYDGDPRVVGATKLNTEIITINDLDIGEIFLATGITVNGPGPNFTLYIVLNDAGTSIPISLPNTNFIECDYDNNVIFASIVPFPASLTAELLSDNILCDINQPANGAVRAYINTGGLEETAGYTFNWFNGGVVSGIPDFVGAVYANIPAGTYAVFAEHNTANCSSDTAQITVSQVVSTINVNILLTAPYTNCTNPNGELTADVNNGDPVALYEYEWYQGDNVFTSPLIGAGPVIGGLGPGKFTVLVREKSTLCEVITTYTILDDSVIPVASASTTNVFCSGLNSGSASADVGGITAGFTFEWYDGNSVKPTADFTGSTYNNIPVGDYTVVASDNTSNCGSAPVTVTVIAVPDPIVSASVVAQQTSCDSNAPNGGLTANVGGLTAGYTFTWFEGQGTGGNVVSATFTASALTAGTYTVLAVDDVSGCSDTEEINITDVIAYPTVMGIVDAHQTICDPANYNGQVSATVGGVTAGYTFYWFNGNIGTPDINNPDFTGAVYSGLNAGEYTVVAVDNATFCPSTPMVVQVLDNTIIPVLNTVHTDNTACDVLLSNGTITSDVGGTTAGYTFHVFAGQNTNPVNEVAGSPSSGISNLQVGTYTVLAVNDATGCYDTEEVDILNNITIPTISTSANSVSVCNPANGTITVTVSIGVPADYTFSWYNGSLLKATPDYLNTTNMLTGLIAGNYTVTAFNNVLGCNVQAPQTITINNDPATAITVTEIAADRILPANCNSGVGQLGVQASSLGNVGGFTFSWYQGDKNSTMTFVGNGTNYNPPSNANRIGSLSNGRYTVIALDNDTQCQDSLVMDLPYIDEHNLLSVTTFDQTHCTIPDGAFEASITPGVTAAGLGADQTWYEVQIWRGGINIVSVPGVEPGPTIFTGLSSGDYTILAVETHPALAGCSSSPTDITIGDASTPPVVAVNILSDNKRCIDATNDTGSISLTIDGVPTPGAGYTYVWHSGQLDSDPVLPGANTPAPGHTAINLAGGFYTVEVTNNGNTCTTVETIYIADDIDIVKIAIGDIIITDQNDCSPINGTANINFVTVNGVKQPTGGFTFDWFESDGTTLIAGAGNAATPAINLAVDLYYVQATDNVLGCSTSPVQFEIEDISKPPVVVMVQDAPNTICDIVTFTPNGQLSASVTEGVTTGVTTGYNFEWFTGQNNTNPANALPPANITGADNQLAINLAPGFYTIRVTDNTSPNNSCLTVATLELQDKPDMVTIGSADLVVTPQNDCSPPNGSATINFVTVNGVQQPAGGFTFDWFDASMAALPGPVTPNIYTGLIAGTYFVRASDNNTGCITSLVEIEILDNTSLPVITLTSFTNPTLCRQPNFSGELSVTADGSTNTTDYTFNWYQGISAAAGTPIPGNTPVLTGLIAGDYTLEVVNNATGCTDQATYTLNTEILPIILNASGSALTSCITSDGSVFATVVSGNSNNYDYNWYIGNTVKVSPDFTGKQVNGLTAGNYTVVAIDQMDAGCASLPVTVTVTDARSYPVIDLTQIAPQTNCDPTIPNAAAMATVNGSVVGYTFEWFNGTSASGAPFYTGSSVNGLQAIAYTVLATNIVSGCTNTATITIEEKLPVVPNPGIEIISHMTSCIAPNGALTTSVGGNTNDYIFNWYIGQSVAGPPVFTGEILNGLDAGWYTVTATSRISGCISGAATIEVIEDLTYPEFEFVITNASCNESNGAAAVAMTNNVSVESILWQTPQGEVVGPNLFDFPPGNYDATVTTLLGCSTTKTATILTEIIVYNGISINGDNANDLFEISCIESYPDNNVKIFNRAGTLVYENQGYDNQQIFFEGQSNRGTSILGKDLPSGTYFYVIDKNDGSKLVSGYLELINK